MLIQLVLLVDSQEIPTEVYFKKDELADLWIKHHYLFVAELVRALRKTRDFELKKRRIL